MEDRDFDTMFEGLLMGLSQTGKPTGPTPDANDAVTFDALTFAPHSSPGFDSHAKTKYPNGYGASVVRGRLSYGGADGEYELAVFKDGSICYDTPITDDVVGHLSPAQVTELLGRIVALPSREKE